MYSSLESILILLESEYIYNNMENTKQITNYRGICFDLDQTLCNSEDFIYSFFRNS